MVAKLNRTMIGWANYFCLGPVRKACRAVESHARNRPLQWLSAKHELGKKESATDRLNLNHRVTPRLHLQIARHSGRLAVTPEMHTPQESEACLSIFSEFAITPETLPRYRLPIRGTFLGVLQ